MKKEWLAVAILICVTLGSVLNLRFLKSFTQELDAQIGRAVFEAESENWTTAENMAADAMRDWTGMDKYSHIFIRHGEIDAVTDAFCAFLGTLRSRDTATLFAAQLALRNRLAELYEMERVTPGSIL